MWEGVSSVAAGEGGFCGMERKVCTTAVPRFEEGLEEGLIRLETRIQERVDQVLFPS